MTIFYISFNSKKLDGETSLPFSTIQVVGGKMIGLALAAAMSISPLEQPATCVTAPSPGQPITML